ncbi:MAG TPA: AAA family ATPase [Candidatus Deferrimicrobiaceae bacterium]|nr:AAA family ATPase [Candidatus Deferrimicrobiaceae bacterium]
MTPKTSTSTVTLPEPCLVVLVGAAGAGKTTLATRLFEPDEILSSDAYRGLIAGDPADQSATRAAFAALHRDLARRLARRRTTVVDATNVTAFARRTLLRRAASHDVPAVAVVLDLEPGLVIARNAARPGRTVPETAVQSQLRDLARALGSGAIASEGFAAIHRLRTSAAVDGLVIRRTEVRPSRRRSARSPGPRARCPARGAR